MRNFTRVYIYIYWNHLGGYVPLLQRKQLRAVFQMAIKAPPMLCIIIFLLFSTSLVFPTAEGTRILEESKAGSNLSLFLLWSSSFFFFFDWNLGSSCQVRTVAWSSFKLSVSQNFEFNYSYKFQLSKIFRYMQKRCTIGKLLNVYIWFAFVHEIRV